MALFIRRLRNGPRPQGSACFNSKLSHLVNQLESKARRQEVRWFQTPTVSRPPTVQPGVEALVVRMARENTGWGYDRIVGALANLGHRLSDQTVGNVLRRHGIAPAPKRSQTTSWKDFIAAHMNILAGADFFTVEVLSWRGLVTYYVFFFIHLESRRVRVAGITRHPDQEWMEQIGRSATQETWGYLHPCRYVLHDRDTKFCASFGSVLAAGGVKAIFRFRSEARI